MDPFKFIKPVSWKVGEIVPKYYQVKIDGHRIKFIKRRNDIIALTTSKNDISYQLRDFGWFKNIENYLTDEYDFIDGELWAVGVGAESIKTKLVERCGILFAAFATSKLSQFKSIDEVNTHLELNGFEYPKTELIGSHSIENLLQICRDSQLEGFVLKDGNYLNWYKIKVKKTIDLIVCGFKPGRLGSKYDDTVGSIECGTAEGYIVANISGMNDLVRYALTKIDIGRVVEVEYQRVGTRGRLRHPQFKRWRDDKLSSDCLLSQDVDLENFWKDKICFIKNFITI